MKLVQITAVMVLLALSAPMNSIGQDGVFPAGKRHLYIHCEGQRHGPVVIFSTGLYREASDWRLVMPEIAHFTQACSYDREGLVEASWIARRPAQRAKAWTSK